MRVIVDTGDEEAVALARQIHQILLGDRPAAGSKGQQEGDALLKTHGEAQEAGIEERRSSTVQS